MHVELIMVDVRRGSRNFRQGGVPTFRKCWQQAKKKQKNKVGGEGCGSFPSLRKNGLNQFSRQLFAYKLGGGGVGHGKSLSTQIHRWHGRFDIVNMFGKGGLGVLPQKNFQLKWCKNRVILDKNNMKMPKSKGIESWILVIIWIRGI